MNPAVVHKHNMSFYIPQYKRWRGETYFFLNCQVTYPVWVFFSSACKKKQIVLTGKTLIHLIHVRQIT